MSKIFASELSKCRKLKFLYGFLLSLSVVVLVIGVPVYLTLKTPIPKTDRDYVKEYILERMNFTPDTIYQAYHSEYQYVFPLYDETIRDEITYAQQFQIYQQFILTNLLQNRDKSFTGKGILVKFSCKETCNMVYRGRVLVNVKKVKDGRFVVESIQEGY